METTKEQSAAEKIPGGVVGDFHRLKVNGAATVAELRDFLAQTRGKSPQEVLGMVAGSNLVWSTLLATVITVVLMAAFTAGPYYLSKGSPQKPPVAPAAAAVKPAEVKPVEKPVETAVADKPAKTNKDQALKALEMDEAKISDPKKNPLEGSKELESLLDKNKLD